LLAYFDIQWGNAWNLTPHIENHAKLVFSPFKQLTAPPVEAYCPSCRIPVGALVELVGAPIENDESKNMGEINGGR